MNRILTPIVLLAFLANSFGALPIARADDFRLPAPGVMVRLSPPLDPPMLKGIKVHPNNPLLFDFILNKGDGEITNTQIKDESSKLIRYFLASLTIPEKDLWVNLSPYEKDRIIPNSFGLTEMGRDLLAEDYMLKQITASLIYPEDEIGKKFWKRIYEEALKRYGTTNISVNTFNKVWIVPEKAVVYENAKAGTAYVMESKLKVMLEQDYLSLEKHVGIQSIQSHAKDTNQLGSQIVREIVIPELTTEVNENKNFARLRQVYNSLILATWYKRKIKDSILSQVYNDKNKVAGVNIKDPQEKEKIYQRYLRAFKKGVYNFIKEDIDPVNQETIPRKYFSGGMKLQFNFAMNSTGQDRSNTFEIRENISSEALNEDVSGQDFDVEAGARAANITNIPKPIGHQHDLAMSALKDTQWNNWGTGELFKKLGEEFSPTIPIKKEKKNRFTDYVAKHTDKTEEELEQELNWYAILHHVSLYYKYGFLSAESSPMAKTVNRIFKNVVDVYNVRARQLGQPDFRGKLFLVDSPEVNAYIIAGHDDVYMHVGLIRELAKYCEKNNIEFTEDMIAFIFAHEMQHLLQGSTYEGVPFQDLNNDKVMKEELLDLKRMAEYDADEGGAFLLGKANYNPKVSEVVMQFLNDITHRSTAEDAIAEHPHPKERLVELQKVLSDKRFMPFNGSGNISLQKDINDFIYWPGRHLGQKVTDVHSMRDAMKLMRESKSWYKFMETVEVMMHTARSARAIATAKTEEAKSAFAKRAFYDGVSTLIEKIAGEVSSEDLKKILDEVSPPKTDELWFAGEEKEITIKPGEISDGNVEESRFLGLGPDGQRILEELKNEEILKQIPGTTKLRFIKDYLNIRRSKDLERIVKKLGVAGDLEQKVEDILYASHDDYDKQGFEQFKRRVEGVITSIRINSSLSSKEKIKRQRIIQQLYREVERLYNEKGIDGQKMYQQYIQNSAASKEDIDRFTEGLRNETLEGSVPSIVQSFMQRPYFVYMAYSRKNLNVEVNAKDFMVHHFDGFLKNFGIDAGILQDEKIALERPSVFSYMPDLRVAPLNTPQDREKFFEALSIQGYRLECYRNAPSLEYPLKLQEDLRSVIHEGINNMWSDLKIFLMDLGFEKTGLSEQEVRDWMETTIYESVSQGSRNLNGDFKYWALFYPMMRFFRSNQVLSGVFASEAGVNLTTSFFYNDDALIKEPLRHLEIHAVINELTNNGDNFGGVIAKEIIIKKFSHKVENGVFVYSRKKEDGSLEPITSDEYFKEVRVVLRTYLEKYSSKFRANAISSFSGALSMLPAQTKGLLDEFCHPQDSFRVLIQKQEAIYKSMDGSGMNSGFSYEYYRKIFANDFYLNDQINLMEWMISHRPTSYKVMSDKFLSLYVMTRLFRVANKLVNYYKEVKETKKLEELTSDERDQIANNVLNTQEALSILNTAASGGLLKLTQLKNNDRGAQQSNLLIGSIGKDIWNKMESDFNKTNQIQSQEVSSNDIPIVYFNSPWQKDGVPNNQMAFLMQRLFRLTFDFSKDELMGLAHKQREMQKGFGVERGRIKQSFGTTNAIKLIDQMILLRSYDEMRNRPTQFSSKDLSPLMEARIVYGLVSDSKNEAPTARIEIRQHEMSDFANRWIRGLNLDSDNAMISQEAVEFFKSLGHLEITGDNQDMDKFCELISESPMGLELFPYYYQWMTDPQIPSAKDKPKVVFKERISYLEALASNADILGAKARIFKRYIKKHPELLNSSVPFGERWKRLSQYLTKATLFRDGFIDQWEREIFPEMDFSRDDTISRFLLRKKTQEEGFDDFFGMFQGSFMMLPLQMERLRAVDAKGKPKRFNLTETQARDLLAFYKVTIPQVFNPQRQWRMGATALRIFREINPRATFQEELDAIKTYYPMADSHRDEELDTLMDRHEVQDVNEVRLMYSRYQRLEYDPERTNADYMEQVIKALLSVATREDRLEMLLWILDHEKNPMPAIIDRYQKASNVDFTEIPQHFSLAPKAYKMKVFESVFMGENGIFSPQLAEDEQVLQKASDALFKAFFPERKQTKSKLQQFDKDTYEFVRELFGVVLKTYPPGMRTQVVLSLLDEYDKLGEKSDGEKLAILLAALGPEGVKIGQILSESSHIIPIAAIRSDLGTLKKRAEPISKMDVIEVILEAGIPLTHVKIGRRLASASIGQVHEGQYLIEENGKARWIPIIIKVIRPRIRKIRGENKKVIAAVLTHIKEKYKKDYERIGVSVNKWVDTETDLRVEVSNGHEMESVVEDYQRKDTDALPMSIPKIYLDKKNVIFEERVHGDGVSAILERNGVDGEDGIIASEIISKLRRFFLFSVFEEGLFHADLHSDNIMFAENHFYLIDLGLVGRLNGAQLKGARAFLKGVLLHDNELVFEGMKGIIENSPEVSVEQRSDLIAKINAEKSVLLDEITKVFKKGLNIKTEMQTLTELVTKRDFVGQEDFSNFIKAFTTAIWLFPTSSIKQARETLSDMSKALGMTDAEMRRATLTHAWTVAKDIMITNLDSIREPFGAAYARAVGPTKHYLSEQWKAIKYRWQLLRLSKGLRATPQKKEENKLAEIHSTIEESNSLQTTESVAKIASINFTAEVEYAQYPIKIDEERFRQFCESNKFTEQEIKLARFTIEQYFKILLYVSMNKKPMLSALDNFLININKDSYERSFTAKEIIARVLATQITRLKILRDTNGSKDQIMRDFLMPNDPGIRSLWQKVAQSELLDFNEKDYKASIEKFYGEAVKRASYETTIGNNYENSLYIFDSNERRDGFETQQTESQSLAPLNVVDQNFMTAVYERVKETSTDKNEIIDNQRWAALIQRKNFTKEGQISIHIYDRLLHKLIVWEVNEGLIEGMALNNTPIPMTVETWSLNYPSTYTEWERLSNESLDMAMTNVTHEKRNFAGVIIETLASPDIEVLLPDDVVQRDKTTGEVYGHLFLQEYTYVGDQLKRLSQRVGISYDEVKQAFHDELLRRMQKSPYSGGLKGREWLRFCLGRAANALDVAYAKRGGIDLTPTNMNLRTQNAGESIKFHINPSLLAQLQAAPGFVPVIINIQPINNIKAFLGISA